MRALLLSLFLATTVVAQPTPQPNVQLVVLGVAQDGGFPHTGCHRDCCAEAWRDPRMHQPVVALGLVDATNQQRWMFEATPSFPTQLYELEQHSWVAKRGDRRPLLDGIFVTHAHIGHYTGLMFLGREVLGASEVPVYAMPRMQKFLHENGPWGQLVRLENIQLKTLAAEKLTPLNRNLKVTPLLVPHRDEYSETVGFIIEGPKKNALFLPDIDKWTRWDKKIEDLIANVDVAFLDGTFYDGKELPNRNMAEIPHPFIVESMARFAKLPLDQKAKIHFIHFNHTNPVMSADSAASRRVEKAGYRLARRGQVFSL